MFRRLAVVVLLVVVAPYVVSSAFATETPRRQVNVNGTYDSNWDLVTLRQDGDRVSGTYVCCGGGTIEGRVYQNRVIRYHWKQPGGEGEGIWEIVSPDKLEGTWGIGQSDSDGGRWDLTRKATLAN